MKESENNQVAETASVPAEQAAEEIPEVAAIVDAEETSLDENEEESKKVPEVNEEVDDVTSPDVQSDTPVAEQQVAEQPVAVDEDVTEQIPETVNDDIAAEEDTAVVEEEQALALNSALPVEEEPAQLVEESPSLPDDEVKEEEDKEEQVDLSPATADIVENENETEDPMIDTPVTEEDPSIAASDSPVESLDENKEEEVEVAELPVNEVAPEDIVPVENSPSESADDDSIPVEAPAAVEAENEEPEVVLKVASTHPAEHQSSTVASLDENAIVPSVDESTTPAQVPVAAEPEETSALVAAPDADENSDSEVSPVAQEIPADNVELSAGTEAPVPVGISQITLVSVDTSVDEVNPEKDAPAESNTTAVPYVTKTINGTPQSNGTKKPQVLPGLTQRPIQYLKPPGLAEAEQSNWNGYSTWWTKLGNKVARVYDYQ